MHERSCLGPIQVSFCSSKHLKTFFYPFYLTPFLVLNGTVSNVNEVNCFRPIQFFLQQLTNQDLEKVTPLNPLIPSLGNFFYNNQSEFMKEVSGTIQFFFCRSERLKTLVNLLFSKMTVYKINKVNSQKKLFRANLNFLLQL